MKYKLLIIVGVIIVIILVYVLIFKKKVEITSIKKFHYSYSTGNMMNANVSYDISCDDKCIAIIKPNGIGEEEALEIEIDEKKKEELENILRKYNVSKWNGFNKNNKHVLDGNGFSLFITMKDDSYLSATGYMRWPKNYSDVRGNIDEFFMNIYNDNNRSE